MDQMTTSLATAYHAGLDIDECEAALAELGWDGCKCCGRDHAASELRGGLCRGCRHEVHELERERAARWLTDRLLEERDELRLAA